MPVRQFERRIESCVSRQCLLCRDASLKDVAFVDGVIGGKRCHKLRCFIDESAVLLKHLHRRYAALAVNIHRCIFGLGLGSTIEQFSKIDGMRLLPDKVRTHIGRGFLCTGISHLHPSHSLIALSAGYLARHRLSLEIP